MTVNAHLQVLPGEVVELARRRRPRALRWALTFITLAAFIAAATVTFRSLF